MLAHTHAKRNIAPSCRFLAVYIIGWLLATDRKKIIRNIDHGDWSIATLPAADCYTLEENVTMIMAFHIRWAYFQFQDRVPNSDARFQFPEFRNWNGIDSGITQFFAGIGIKKTNQNRPIFRYWNLTTVSGIGIRIEGACHPITDCNLRSWWACLYIPRQDVFFLRVHASSAWISLTFVMLQSLVAVMGNLNLKASHLECSFKMWTNDIMKLHLAMKGLMWLSLTNGAILWFSDSYCDVTCILNGMWPPAAETNFWQQLFLLQVWQGSGWEWNESSLTNIFPE